MTSFAINKNQKNNAKRTASRLSNAIEAIDLMAVGSIDRRNTF